MNIEPWLHFAHIGAAMIWVGGGVILMMVGLRVRRSADVAFMREFARTLSYVGLRVLTPAVVVVLASGIWLALQQSRSFGELWILLALGAFALAFLIGAVFLSRNAIALERQAAMRMSTALEKRSIVGSSAIWWSWPFSSSPSGT